MASCRSDVFPLSIHRVEESERQFITKLDDLLRNYHPGNEAVADFGKHHSWDEVLEEARAAQEAYEKRASGPKGYLSRMGRSQKPQYATSVLQAVLPMSDYTSFVCGS